MRSQLVYDLRFVPWTSMQGLLEVFQGMNAVRIAHVKDEFRIIAA